MNWLFLLIIAGLPLIVLLFAPAWAPFAAVIGVTAGLGLWFLQREEGHPLYPAAGFLGGLAALWLAGLLGLGAGTLIPLLGMAATYVLVAKQNAPRPATLGVAAVAVGILGLVFSGGGAQGGSIGTAQRIVIFGDSLTAGVPTDGVTEKWPEILQSLLGPGAEVVAHAFPGDTAGASLDRWNDVVTRPRWHPERPDWEPEVVILLLGGNDILRRRGAEALRADLERWAAALSRFPNTRALLLEVPSNPLTGSYRGTWRGVAQSRPNFFWAEDTILRGVFGDRQLTLADGIHLNQQGHRVLAERIHARLQQ